MKQTGKNSSVEKTLKIIEALAGAAQPMSLSALSAMVEMPASTVLRMVNTLVENGYAYQEDETRCYALTLRFLQIGQMSASHISIRDIAHPFLVQISSLTGEASCLAILEEMQLRYIDVVEGNGNIVTIRQKIGGSASMHCTGSGKLFLMQRSPEELDAFIARYGLPAMTVHTLVTREDLVENLMVCKKRGYAVDDEECEIGMRCLAVPVMNSNGEVVASMSVSGPISRMTGPRCETEILPQLCNAAKKVSQKLTGASA